MADFDNDKVNDLEVAVIGSGSMGAVSTYLLTSWRTKLTFRE
jgi:hypothetical protein